MSSIKEKLENLPTSPGVYIYKGAKGNILYVGKAKVLRSRVRSYFRESADLDPAKQEMVSRIADIETIAVDSETEALILEANLIRKHQPPYNVVLRDDKYYLFIKITMNEEFPRVFPIRRINKDGARYFGPYSSARSVRQTLKLLRRIFPYRAEQDTPNDMIFPHPLFSRREKSARHSPLASRGDGGLYPKNSIPLRSSQEQGGYGGQAEYSLNIQNIIRFLRGDRQEIIDVLQHGMKEAAIQENYERASIFRDQLQAIERLEGNQKVFLPRKESFDVVSIARSASRSAANVFQIREGKLLGKQTFLLSHRASSSLEDTLRQFLLQYYRVAQDIPSLIFIPVALADQNTLATFINSETAPTFAVPQRGKKRQLLAMGETNAQLLLDEQEAVFQTDTNRKQAMKELFAVIGQESHFAKATRDNSHVRVETYDVSNIQGKLSTASMVVFIDGQSTPSLYRKFRLSKSNELFDDAQSKPNDFAMLQEALGRRFGNHQSDWPMPDLVVIDGGKGQLSSAVAVLRELNVTVPIISLAKREEEIFLPGQSQPVRLSYDSPALQLLQRMRDEAHRFTITYHRLLRSKRQQRSILDEIPGIGPKTKKRLLSRFGSLKGIRAASDEELANVIGESKVAVIRDYL